MLLYSRGERSCHAFEVQPSDPKNLFSRLPTFEHGTLQAGFAFLPKARNDIKAVEIIKALRLTPSTVESISFSVPRARLEFFQDDVFIPTRDGETPALSAKEWVEGKDAKLRLVELRPEGLQLREVSPGSHLEIDLTSCLAMSSVSTAPITAARASTRSKVGFVWPFRWYRTNIWIVARSWEDPL